VCHEHTGQHGPRRGHHRRLVRVGEATARALAGDGYGVALVAAARRVQDELGGADVLVNNAAYAATKWGMNGWSESLRQELLPAVRVIVVEPGAVATELTDHITDDETKQGVEQFAVNEILVRPSAQA
jgi:NADP-dependent 3-hydroxy acid dehydrogenase YdfG